MLNVLLVEDDNECAGLTCLLLESPPGRYRVTRVATIADGRRALETCIFDVLLLDLMLPDGNGRELLEIAQALDPRLPVIVMSSMDDRDTTIELINAGAEQFIAKETFTDPVAFQEYIWEIVRSHQTFRDAFDVAVGKTTAVEGSTRHA